MTNLEVKSLIEQMKKIDGLNKQEIISFIATKIAGLNLTTETYLTAVFRVGQIYASTEYKTFASRSDAEYYLISNGFTACIDRKAGRYAHPTASGYTLAGNEFSRPICEVVQYSVNAFCIFKEQTYIENNQLVVKSERL